MKNIKNFSIFPLLIMGVFLVFASSCEKDDDDNNGQQNVPVLSTTEVTEITANTATSGGNLTDDGGTTVTARGVCWSTGQTPTISDNKTEDGTGAGSFTSSVTDLEPNTTYYLRAYATNSAGTGYGSAMSFTTQEGSSGSTFTDPRDGKVYQTVVIGNQEWLAENLAYAPSSGNYWAYTDNISWSNLTTGAYCDYSNTPSNSATYGKLYNWYAATNAHNIAPTGWHVPTDADWTTLTTYLGGEGVAGGKLKETGTTHWQSPNIGATNETGFTALPGGIRNYNGSFDYIGSHGYWWSATESGAASAWLRFMGFSYSYVFSYGANKELGFSVRCVRD
jgi:uncharacterized protein (TIGR02145 family)